MTTQPDSEGKLTVDVESGFDGFLEVTDALKKTVTPALLQVSPPVYETRTGPPALLTSPFSFDFIARGINPSGDGGPGGADPNLAQVLFRTHDCNDQSLAGISVRAQSSDPNGQTRLFYLYGLAPRTDVDETDPSARGGIFNLPPGETTLTATVRATGKKLGSVSVGLRKGFVTYVIITPSL